MKYLLLFIILIFGSCKNYYLTKYCKKEIRINIKDSTVVVKRDSISVHIKDSIRIINGGSTEIIIDNPCDSILGVLKGINQSSKSGRNTLTVKSDNNRLIIRANCEDIIQRFRNSIYVRDRKIDSLNKNVYDSHVTIEKKQKINLWDKFKMSIAGDILILIGVVSITFALIKLKQ